MERVSIIGVDLAKRGFQLHGARADGSVAFRVKLSREEVLGFLAEQPRCVVAMEACASAYHWGREIEALGHAVKLIPPICVKPYVKRQKNDAAVAEAIAEAASSPTMRFVEVKTPEQQGLAMLFRTRDLLVRQRIQTVNALRGHLAEFGIVAPQGTVHVRKLSEAIEDPDAGLPQTARDLARLLFDQFLELQGRIKLLEREVRHRAPRDERVARLMTVPGVGPICAMAVQAFAPSMRCFEKGRDLAAWVGLTPRQRSTGGKARLGRASKMGQRDLRRLFIVGASAVIGWASRKPPREGSWLHRMMARKPRMLVAVALANKMARTIWALLTKGGTCRDPALAA